MFQGAVEKLGQQDPLDSLHQHYLFSLVGTDGHFQHALAVMVIYKSHPPRIVSAREEPPRARG